MQSWCAGWEQRPPCAGLHSICQWSPKREGGRCLDLACRDPGVGKRERVQDSSGVSVCVCVCVRMRACMCGGGSLLFFRMTFLTVIFSLTFQYSWGAVQLVPLTTHPIQVCCGVHKLVQLALYLCCPSRIAVYKVMSFKTRELWKSQGSGDLMSQPSICVRRLNLNTTS